MKGSTAKVLLKSLRGKRREIFLSRVQQDSNGKAMAELCLFLFENPTAVEPDILAACGLSKGQYFHWMDAIGGHLLAFFGGEEPASIQGRSFAVAAYLIKIKEPDAAVDLIRQAIKEAAEIEDFEQVLRLWGLAASIRPLPVMDVLKASEARILRKNLIAFEDLLAEFQEARNIMDVRERQRVMRSILQHDLLSSETKALSKRALKLYLKLSSGHIFLQQWEDSLPYQQALVDFLVSTSWISLLHEEELVQEIIMLAGILLILNRTEDYSELESKLVSLRFVSAKAEHERTAFLLPTQLAAAIQRGDTVRVIDRIEAFFEYVEQHEVTDSYFITFSLYRCLYGAISIRSDKLRIKTLRALSQRSKSDFRPQHFAMYRFLEIIIAIEDGDWELAKQRLQNPRRRAVLESVLGMKELIAFFSFLISTWDRYPDRRFHLDADATTTLLGLTASSEVLEYFDLLTWLEAQRSGRSMSEIIQDRASRS